MNPIVAIGACVPAASSQKLLRASRERRETNEWERVSQIDHRRYAAAERRSGLHIAD
jgi:hypothetical protein